MSGYGRGQRSGPPELDLGRTARYIGRAFRLRCPECGRGRMFDRWVMMRAHCGDCGLRFDRGENDFFIGAYTVNLILAELAVVAGMLAGMLLTWPDVPWKLLPWILLPLAIGFPALTYPLSKALWLAIDLIYRPAAPADFIDQALSRAST